MIKAQFGSEVIGVMIPDITMAKTWIRLSVYSIGLTFLIIAMAGPQSGSQTRYSPGETETSQDSFGRPLRNQKRN